MSPLPKLLFVTGNAGKFAEVKSLIPTVEQLDLDLDEIQEIDPQRIIEHKLQQAVTETQQTSGLLVEDTSLYCDGMNGLPGPFIKWFVKELGAAGIAEMIGKLSSQAAVARTVIGYARGADDVQYFVGELAGTIVPPRGDNGFGWDSIFQPQGSDKTFAEMTQAEKTKLSMRRLAVEQLRTFLDA